MTTERAGWWTRVGAQIIDGLIITAVGFVAMIIVSIAGGGNDAMEIALYAVIIVATVAYSTYMLQRPGDVNGQTIGKRSMGIRVVRPDGLPITSGLAARREIVGKGILGLIPLYGLVDVLWPLGDAQNQAIHDKVADTYVVPASALSTPGSPPAQFAPPAPAYTPPAAPPPKEPASAPDLGDFTPPVAPAAPPKDPDDDVPGPFGPSYDD